MKIEEKYGHVSGKNPIKLVEYLEDKMGVDKVSKKRADLLSYSHDYWPISLHWMLEGKVPSLPAGIVWPSSGEDVVRVTKLCHKYKVPLYVYGGGSGVLGAAVPEKRGIVLDMKRMREMKVHEDDLIVEACAGMNGYHLEDELNDNGFTLGNIPQSLFPSTLGGWIGTKATGQFSTRYGGIEEMVLGLEIVLPNGKKIKLKPHPRTATGPDLRQLFIGSEGTLGIITKAWLKIWPYPEKREKLCFVTDSVEDAVSAVKNMMRRGAKPAVVRIYDKIETKRHFYDFDELYGKIATIVIVEGDAKIVDPEVEIVKEEFEEGDIIEGPADEWLETRFNVKEASEFVPMGVVFDTIEVAARWSDALDLFKEVKKSMGSVKGVLFASAHASHFYPQGICFYFTFAGTAPRGTDVDEFYDMVWDAAMESTIENGGTISHHHGIGRQRARWMSKELGGGYSLLKRIKDTVDENDIMNPGNMGV